MRILIQTLEDNKIGLKQSVIVKELYFTSLLVEDICQPDRVFSGLLVLIEDGTKDKLIIISLNSTIYVSLSPPLSNYRSTIKEPCCFFPMSWSRVFVCHVSSIQKVIVINLFNLSNFFSSSSQSITSIIKFYSFSHPINNLINVLLPNFTSIVFHQQSHQ